MPSITSLGIGSGLDLEGIVNQLVAAEGEAESVRLAQQEALYQAELSGLGAFRSALAAFQDTLTPLADADTFGLRTVTSGNEELFTVSATGAAYDGSYDIEVLQLAESQKLRSIAFTSADPEVAAADSAVGTGTLTITIGENTLNLEITEENDSLNEIALAINESEDNPGVSASVVTGDDGAYLVFSGTDTGTESEMTITVADATGSLDQLAYDPENLITNMTELTAAQDAQVAIDGIVVTSSTNTVTDAIGGVTLNLVSAEPGTTARLGVALDISGTRTKIESFVDAYNSMIDSLAGLNGYDAETGASGILQGDNLIPVFLSQIRSEIGGVVDTGTDELSLLSQMGITTDPSSGRLQIDDSTIDFDDPVTLASALEDNFDLFDEFFAGENGLAVRADAVVARYLESDGIIDDRVSGVEGSLEDVEEQRIELEEDLLAYEERLRAEFIALDLLVAELSSTSSFLSSQLAALSPPSSSGS